MGRGVPKPRRGEDCSLLVAQLARKVTTGEVVVAPGDLLGNARRLEGVKNKNPPIVAR